MFKTSEGQRTGAELAQELVNRPESRLEFYAKDGSLSANVRGGKTIVNGKLESVQWAVEKQKQERGTGCGQGGGGLAAKKLMDLGELGSSHIDPDLKDVVPLIRELGEGGVVEVLGRWVSVPPKSRVRGGREHKVLKGVAHLLALKATQSMDDIRDGEQTLARHGEVVDLMVGRNPLAPIDPVRTLSRALACGGYIDDANTVRQVHITVDAPDLFFIMDGSGSMQGQRMVAAMASAQALADYYGPKGSRFGAAEITGSDPLVRVPPGEPDAERVMDAVLGLEAKSGTAYAPAVEYAIRACQPKTTVLVFGDFEDSGHLSEDTLAIKSEKGIRIIGITDPTGCASYAMDLCDEVHIVDMSDPAQVALVALKAAE